MNFKDEFYQKLKLLVLPIAIQNFMLALVSATDAIMLGWIDQTSLSAVSLAGQVQFVLSLFISGIAAGAGIMAAQYWGKQPLRSKKCFRSHFAPTCCSPACLPSLPVSVPKC